MQVDASAATVRFEHARTGESTEVRSAKIFGADGAYSGVRLHLQKTELFDYSQSYSTLGYKELAIAAGSAGAASLTADALHIWPRGEFMLIAFPNRDGSFTSALYAPFGGEHSFETLASEPRLLAFMNQQFPDIAAKIPGLAEQFFARAPNTMVTVRCRPWSRAGNVLLVGDAAHSVLPSYGQGANAGFEDCAVLNACLDEHGDDWDAVFTMFEQLRRPNMDVMASLCVDHFLELRERVGDRRFLLHKAIERRLEELHAERFMPLYSMIAFTKTPYVDAVRKDQANRALVERLLAIDGIETAPPRSGDGVDRRAPHRGDDMTGTTNVGANVQTNPQANLVRRADPQPIISLALSFWAAKAVMTAVELGVFACLGRGQRTGEALAADLGLAGRGARDFFDALVALGFCSTGARPVRTRPWPRATSTRASVRTSGASSR